VVPVLVTVLPVNSPDEYFPIQGFKYPIIDQMTLFAFLLADHWLAEPARHDVVLESTTAPAAFR